MRISGRCTIPLFAVWICMSARSRESLLFAGFSELLCPLLPHYATYAAVLRHATFLHVRMCHSAWPVLIEAHQCVTQGVVEDGGTCIWTQVVYSQSRVLAKSPLQVIALPFEVPEGRLV